MTVYLVCYDVGDDDIRLAIAKVLLEYGNRVQRSVFEVAVRSQAELDGLIERLKTVAEDEQDIRLYRLCKNCRDVSMTLENQPIALFPSTIIV